MSSNWLAGIGGAAGGLQEMLARQIAEEKWQQQQERINRVDTENERSNRATEQYRTKQLEQQGEQNRLTATSLEDYRKGQIADRNADNIYRRESSRIVGSDVDPREFDQATGGASGVGVLPMSAYHHDLAPDQAAVDEGVPSALAQNDPSGKTSGVIKFTGIADDAKSGRSGGGDQRSGVAINDIAMMMYGVPYNDPSLDEEKRRAVYARREQIEKGLYQQRREGTGLGQFNSPRDIGQAQREGVPVGTRSSDIGGETVPPLVPPAVRAQELGYEVGLDQLDNLEKLFNDGAKNSVGPLAGRARALGQKIPGIEADAKFADFEAATASFRNSIIKAITGAQMSEVEAKRIREQIPEITDKPEVWASKARQSRINYNNMLTRIQQMRQRGGAPASPAVAPAAADPYEEYMRRQKPPQ